MKTDPLFYELFQAAPQTFFELLQITHPVRVSSAQTRRLTKIQREKPHDPTHQPRH
jgi:predicted transposase YdaD